MTHHECHRHIVPLTAAILAGGCQSVGPVNEDIDEEGMTEPASEGFIRITQLMRKLQASVTKRAFGVIMLIFSMADTGPAGAQAVLTIPTS